MEKMFVYVPYKPSNHFDDFHIAGFAYHDGLEVIHKLKPGTKVRLMKEIGNPYDANAVAIFYKEYKIGYVPKTHNAIFSKLLHFGYGNMFKAKIQMVDLENHPEQQIRVVVRLKDSRKKK